MHTISPSSSVTASGATTATSTAIAFNAGSIFATTGARELMFRAGLSKQALLRRHLRGDWGDVDGHDRAVNDRALARGGRLVSVYTANVGERLYVITEADRSATTLLLPSEY